MFDKNGRKRIVVESYSFPRPLFSVATIRQPPLLSGNMAEDQIVSLQYLTFDSFKDSPHIEERIANKNIIFLQIDERVDDILLSKIASAAQKVGTWVVAIVPASCFTQHILQLLTRVDNTISFNNSSIEKSNNWKVSNIIKAFWHSCDGIGLNSIDAADIEDFLGRGNVGHAGIAIAYGKDCVKDALRKAVYDLENPFTPDSSEKKGIFLSIEVNTEQSYDSLLEALNHFSIEHCRDDIIVYTDIYINTMLNDSAITTIIEII